MARKETSSLVVEVPENQAAFARSKNMGGLPMALIPVGSSGFEYMA